jgi:hypothetical protein
MRKVIKSPSRLGMSRLEALERGKAHRLRLKQLVAKISFVKEGDKYPHLYFFSPPGLGKTYTVINHLEDSGISYVQVSGNVSMFAFGIQLAVINYRNPNMEPVVIFVDDCDEILKNEANCNTMKNVLDGSKVFTYEKSLTSQRNNLSDTQLEAIEYYQEEGKMGFTVPTHNLIFVFTSNFKLPVDDEVQLAREKGLSKSVLLSHRNAIRSRCKVSDFDLTSEEQWGWIADVVQNTICLECYQVSITEKQVILDFLWHNWDFLKERSIRLVEKMANTMRDCPNNYRMLWELDYLKN